MKHCDFKEGTHKNVCINISAYTHIICQHFLYVVSAYNFNDRSKEEGLNYYLTIQIGQPSNSSRELKEILFKFTYFKE